MEPMDPMEAVALLDQIVMQVPMSRVQHIQALRAAATIRKALAPKQETPNGDNS